MRLAKKKQNMPRQDLRYISLTSLRSAVSAKLMKLFTK